MQVLKRMRLYSSQIIETESRRAVARGWGEEEMVSYYYLMDTEFHWEMKSSGGGWWSWLHDNVNVLTNIELYT